MSALLAIEVVYCAGPGQSDCVTLLLDAGSCVADALRASGLLQRHALDAAALEVGIWSRLCAPETRLRTADRIEIYRPLKVDPKEARRQRYRQQRTAKA
ncbi:MAG: RnfH family protein [Pseudomonadota bacterium]|nr:RnfH family protein [Pseudomonadota bacterium]